MSDNFPTLSANPASRDAFARNCVEILTHHDFDGIDIDWEVSSFVSYLVIGQYLVAFIDKRHHV